MKSDVGQLVAFYRSNPAKITIRNIAFENPAVWGHSESLKITKKSKITFKKSKNTTNLST